MRLTKRQILLLEQALAIIGLLFYTNGLFVIIKFLGLPSIVGKLLRYGILVPAWITFLQEPKSYWFVLRQGKWILLLLLWVSTSYVWSESPGVTLQGIRSSLIPMALFSLYFSVRFSLKEQFKLILVALGLSTTLSFFTAIALPSIGRHTSGLHVGKWKGIYGHKNTFGAYTALTLFTFILSALYSKKSNLKRWLPTILCGSLTLLSGSKTALLISVFTVIIMLFYRSLRWHGKRTVVFLSFVTVMLVGVILMIAAIWEPLLHALGRDTTLSGRTLIWQYLDGKIQERPIFGYGYKVFWLAPQHFGDIWHVAHHVPSHAHNGFYDLVLDAGLPALLIFVFGWTIAFGKSIRLAYKANQAEYLWPFALLVFQILQNLSESHLIRLESLTWVLYTSALCSLDKWQYEKQLASGSKRSLD